MNSNSSSIWHVHRVPWCVSGESLEKEKSGEPGGGSNARAQAVRSRPVQIARGTSPSGPVSGAPMRQRHFSPSATQMRLRSAPSCDVTASTLLTAAACISGVAPRISFLRTSRGGLSSRSATNREWRRWLSGVHSRKSICPTSFGSSHRRSSIFDAVSPWAPRPLRFLGRLANGQAARSRFRNSRISVSRTFGVNPFRVRAT